MGGRGERKEGGKAPTSSASYALSLAIHDIPMKIYIIYFSVRTTVRVRGKAMDEDVDAYVADPEESGDPVAQRPARAMTVTRNCVLGMN